VIRSFKDKDTEKVWLREYVKKFGSDVQRQGHMQLAVLDAASQLNTLRIPPGNRLEKLTGDRTGQHSIRINDQWRVCFVWRDGGADNVEITDYH
jgi:toxin HigB-1